MRSNRTGSGSDAVEGRLGRRRVRGPRRGYRATAEHLEERQLLAVAIAEVPLPVSSGAPLVANTTSGPDGNVWFNTSDHMIGKVTPTGVVTEYPVPGQGSLGPMAVGLDGDLWFLSNSNPSGSVNVPQAGQITPGGHVALHDLVGSDWASDIAADSDGNLWITEGSRIEVVTSGGEVRAFAMPAGVQATQIVFGPDGNLWFTTSDNRLGNITAGGATTTAGTITIEPWSLGPLTTHFTPGFVVGPDGNFWLSSWELYSPPANPEIITRQVFLIRVTPDGQVRPFPLNVSGVIGENYLDSLTVGSDGNLWLTDSGMVARFALNGEVTPFTPPSGPVAGDITAGPDGNLWFSEDVGGRAGIGQVDLNAPAPATLDAQGAASVTEDRTPSGYQASGPLATFTPLNPTDTADDYVARINWGSGGTALGTVQADGQGGFRVDGLPPGPGTFHPVVTILDVQIGNPGASAQVSTTVNVAGLNPESYQWVEYRGTTTPFLAAYAVASNDSTAYTATIDWGDGSTSTGTVAVNPQSPGKWVVSVTGAHAYVVDGTYNVRARITEATGASTIAESLIQYVTPRVYQSHSINVEARPGVPTGATVPDPPTQPGVGPLSTVGVFQSAPYVPLSDFSATIDWGDGSGPTPGTITSDGPGDYNVSGVHTYAKVGTYRFHVTFSGFGQTTVVSGDAHVNGPALGFSGALNATTDTGYSQHDGITADTTPRFFGAATPGTTVELFAHPEGNGQPFSIGEAVAGSSGLWQITSSALPEGVYTITANQTATDGRHRLGMPVQTGGPNGRLVVDTSGPRITGAVLDPRTSTLTLSFEDNLSQVNPLGLLGRGSTMLSRVRPSGLTPIATRVTSIKPGGGGVTLGVASLASHGHFVLQVAAGSVLDAAGNALDGEFRGILPTGDGHSGGNFLGQFVTSGNAAVAAQPIIAGPAQQQANHALDLLHSARKTR